MKLNLQPIKFNPISKEIKVKEQSKQAAMEKFLRDNYNIYINVMNGKFYDSKDNHMSEINDLNILRECRLMEIVTSKQRIFETLLADNFCPKFNPISHYFKTLPEWKGDNDHIAKLASFVKLVNDKEDRPRFEKHFRKMFVRAVATGLGEDINKHALVFIGGQHKGKTSFCEYLCPTPLSGYRETILPNQVINPRSVALKFWAVMDEMGKFTPKQLEVNKATMVLDRVYFKFFDKYEQPMQRHCNFIATTNYTEIFNDETGNSRFIPVEISDIDWRGYNENVKIDDCWAQALKIYQLNKENKLAFNYHLDSNDIIENDEASLRYYVTTPAMRLIKRFFSLPASNPSEQPEFMNASMIAEFFRKQNEFKYEDKQHFTEDKIGKAMNTLKYPKAQKYFPDKGNQRKGYLLLKNI